MQAACHNMNVSGPDLFRKMRYTFQCMQLSMPVQKSFLKNTSSLTHPVLVVQSKSNKNILFYVRHSQCGQEIVFIILHSVTKPRVGNKYVIYTDTISYYVLMRNVKYISMTQGLTHAIKTMYDGKQPIISVHYLFLESLDMGKVTIHF